jgi:hypothetical protein
MTCISISGFRFQKIERNWAGVTSRGENYNAFENDDVISRIMYKPGVNLSTTTRPPSLHARPVQKPLQSILKVIYPVAE